MKRTLICEKCGKIVSGEISRNLKIEADITIECIKCSREFICGTTRMACGISERQKEKEAEERKLRSLRQLYNMTGIKVNEIDDIKRRKIGFLEYAMSLKPEDDVAFGEE